MDWNRIEGRWDQLTGRVREAWGKLTDDEIEQVAGKRDRLAGLLKKKYGYAKDEIDQQIDAFAEKYSDQGASAAR